VSALYELSIKLRLLWLYRWQFREWKADVWDKEGRGRMCCDGRMCGCYGSDNLSWWEHLLSENRP
jgi:hypothetical protein